MDNNIIKSFLLPVCILILVLCASNNIKCQDPSAIMDLESTEQGVLIPRTDTATVNNAYTPADGLLIFQNSDSMFYYYNGDFWIQLGNGDNLGNHIATENIQLNGNWLSNDGDDEGIFVTDDGKVGIGTSTPTSNLSVVGTSIFNKSQSISNFKVSSDNEVNMLFVHGADDRVGIGTSTPSVKFHIIDNGEGLRIDGTNPLLSFYNSATYNGYLQHDNTDLSLFNKQIGSLFFGTNDVPRMTIKSNGKVGIGTINPSEKLTVK